MIPAALLVFAIPLVGAALAYLARRWNSLEVLVAVVSCVGVILLLARPIGSVITLPGLTIDVDAPLDLVGRTLRVRAADRLPILLMYMCAAVVFALSWRAPQGWTFLPIGLTVLAAMSAALMIRPFVYAALAFEAAAALAALMIQSERTGLNSTRGALRYLALATLALPAFLLAGWVIDRAGTVNLADAEAVVTAFGPAIVLLLAGFALLLGAVPMFTWAHPVAKDAPPLTTAFLGSVGLGAVTFLFLEFWQEYEWLRVSQTTLTALTVGGTALLIFGGALAWAQRSFARVMACAILVDIGTTLLVLSSGTQLSVESLAFGTLSRALSLGLFGLGMWHVRQMNDGNDDFDGVRGRRDIWLVMALAVGGLSLAGTPGTLGFVSKWATARAYSATDAEGLVLLLAANASVAVGVLRGIIAVYSEPLPVIEAAPAIVGDQLALFAVGGDDHAAAIVPATPAQPTDGGEPVDTPETPAPTAPAINTISARLVITIGVAVILILGLWPGLIAPLAQAVAAQYGFYR